MDGGWAGWGAWSGCSSCTACTSWDSCTACTHTRSRTYSPPHHGGQEGEGREVGQLVQEECCLGNSNPIGAGWKTVYNKSEEHKLVAGTKLATVCVLSKDWRVTHEFRFTQYRDGWSNIIQLTLGGSNDQYGDRTPVIHAYLHNSTANDGLVFIASAVNGNINYESYSVLPPVGAWTTIAISQTLEGGKYIYKITIGGKEVHAVENSQPKEFKAVKVYASNPWQEAQPGYIRNLVIETRLQVKWWEVVR